MCAYEIRAQDFRILAFSPNDGVQHGLKNWSLSRLQAQDDATEHRSLATSLSKIFRKIGVRKAYAPSVGAANAAIINPFVLRQRIRLGKDIRLYREYAIPADGMFVWPGEAFVMSAAGCPIIVAVSAAEGLMIVTHAGRDSLIDRGAVLGKPARKNLSVVDAIVETMMDCGVLPGEILMQMHLSIPKEVFEHRFDHPQHGTYNRALNNFINMRWPDCTTKVDNGMLLDLEALFVEQARSAGLRYVEASNSLARFPELTHTRSDRPELRNLIVVKRND